MRTWFVLERWREDLQRLSGALGGAATRDDGVRHLPTQRRPGQEQSRVPMRRRFVLVRLPMLTSTCCGTEPGMYLDEQGKPCVECPQGASWCARWFRSSATDLVVSVRWARRAIRSSPTPVGGAAATCLSRTISAASLHSALAALTPRARTIVMGQQIASSLVLSVMLQSAVRCLQAGLPPNRVF